MDWQSILSDASIVASVSAGIFAVIDFLKKVVFKRWQNKIPPESWFVLSLVLAGAVGIGVYWDDFFGPASTVGSAISAGAYSLLAGTGSKVINAVAGPAGEKLKAAKQAAISQSGNTNTQSGNGGQESQQPSTDAGNSIQPDPPCVETDLGAATALAPIPDTVAYVPKHAAPEPLTSNVTNQVWPYARLLQDVTPDNGKMYYVAFEPLEETLNPMRTNREK